MFYSLSYYFFLFSIISSQFAFSDENTDSKNKITTYQYAGKINIVLEKLKSLGPNEYSQEINPLRLKLRSYFEHKKRVCQGEFSAFVLLGQKGIIDQKKSRKKVRLSKKERSLCYHEMKAMQTTFINNSYTARLRFLEDLHEKKLKALLDLKEKSLSNLQRTFN